MTFRHLILFAPLVTLACGGSGASTVASGGIGGTGISQGPVTAIGSRVVTGTSWDVSSATIRSDGQEFTEDALALGVVVTVEGERSADGLTGTARTVEFDNRIRGPVAGAAAGPGPDETTFTIFGVPVVADAGTILDPADLVLVDGMIVDVYGLVGAGGLIEATRIEDRSGSAEVEVKGTVLAPVGDEFGLDLDGDPFTIELTVVFDDGAPCQPITAFDPNGLRDQLASGPFVEVDGYEIGPATICADRVELDDDGLGDDEDDVEIDGIVTAFNGVDDFRVAGVAVDASTASFFPAAFAPADGDRVQVAGDLVNGVLRAGQVHLKEKEVRVSAEAGGTNLVDETVTVLGTLEFQVDGATEFNGASAALDEIVPGNFLEIRGVQTPAGLVATRIDDAGPVVDDVELRGPVEAIDTVSRPRRLTILGITFEADAPGTDFEGFEDDDISADRFYERVRLGDVVDATDCTPPANVLDFACEVEFDD